ITCYQPGSYHIGRVSCVSARGNGGDDDGAILEGVRLLPNSISTFGIKRPPSNFLMALTKVLRRLLNGLCLLRLTGPRHNGPDLLQIDDQMLLVGGYRAIIVAPEFLQLTIGFDSFDMFCLSARHV